MNARSLQITLPLMLVTLTGCSYGERAVNPMWRNPHPVETIQVTGVAPEPFQVRIKAVYETHSFLPFCNGLYFPDGGPHPLHANLMVATRQQAERVTAGVLADRYAYSLCGWRLRDIWAVVADGDRDKTQVLVASTPRAPFDTYSYEQQAFRVGPAIDTCGYRMQDLGCSEGPVGGASYLPVGLGAGVRKVQFVIRLGAYPAPANYHAPCRDPDSNVPYSPCRNARR